MAYEGALADLILAFFEKFYFLEFAPMDIISMLNLPVACPGPDVKTAYYKALAHYHPQNKQSADPSMFMALQEAYKRFLRGGDYSQCLAVCSGTENIVCRCGAGFTCVQGWNGRIDCEYCSCYIYIDES